MKAGTAERKKTLILLQGALKSFETKYKTFPSDEGRKRKKKQWGILY